MDTLSNADTIEDIPSVEMKAYYYIAVLIHLYS